MRLGVRALSILIALLMLFGFTSAAYAVTPSDWSSEHPELLEEGHLFGESAIVIDADTGNVLFSKNPDARMYPASTTKILTLLLALESGISLDTVVTIPKEAGDVPEGSSVIPVTVGEQMSFRDLLYGFMLNSGNDGALAIAVIVSGTVSDFVALMNQRADEIGCTSSHFANPHGYHDDNHYTTANDMAKIARIAMQNETFRTIASTYEYTLSATNKRGKLVIDTKVELLNPDSKYYYAECVGIKTGYHSKAGQCLVGAAKKGGRTLITVDFHASVDYSDRKWYDAARMFEYGFTRYDVFTIQNLYALSDDGIQNIQVENSAKDDPYGGKLDLILSQTSDDGYSVMSLKDTDEATNLLKNFNQNATVTMTTDYLEKVQNREAIEAGSIIGTLSYRTEEGETITGTLIASRTVELEPLKVTAWEYLTERMPWLLILTDERVVYLSIAALVLLALITVLALVRGIRRNRRRKRIYEQRRRAYYERMRREGGARVNPPRGKTQAHTRSRYDDF